WLRALCHHAFFIRRESWGLMKTRLADRPRSPARPVKPGQLVSENGRADCQHAIPGSGERSAWNARAMRNLFEHDECLAPKLKARGSEWLGHQRFAADKKQVAWGCTGSRGRGVFGIGDVIQQSDALIGRVQRRDEYPPMLGGGSLNRIK